jgi:poly(3-hydroxybutyrate) depolymerase
VTSTGGVQAGGATGGTTTTSRGGSTGSASGGATGTSSGGATGTATGGTTGTSRGGTTGAATGGVAGSNKGGTTGTSTGGTTGARTGGTTGTATGGTTGTAGSSGGYPLANPAVPSTGCGKALSTLKSGSNKMTSAGISREYIIAIPSNYDPSKAYRLVFGMHCMGSSATQCANNDKYYRLQPLDTGSTTIFVAPQGYTDSSPWRGGDNKDHTFFEDMVKLFESELCIDTSRIFSVGFSFGAMFTNSLAQTHQDVLRGVVVYATADYNIYFPANTGKPLAYFGVHGTADGTCPFKSGQSSKERFVKNNGCTVPGSVPEATSSTHVCYDYACPSNYPVKWCTHNGGHTDLPKDPNQSTSWDIDLTWKFITQF